MSTATMSDIEIQRDILDELKWEPSANAAHIGVTVKDGVVTLTGHVPSFWEKYTAEKVAKRVRGVRAIANELDVKLPGASKRTDEDIAIAAANALKASTSVPTDKVKAAVNNGWVTLEDEVEWQYQKDAATAAVRYLTGVTGVTNLITVKPRVSPAELKSKIEDAQAAGGDGRQSHHRRSERGQGDDARHRPVVGREGRGGPRGLVGTGRDHRHSTTDTSEEIGAHARRGHGRQVRGLATELHHPEGGSDGYFLYSTSSFSNSGLITLASP